MECSKSKLVFKKMIDSGVGDVNNPVLGETEAGEFQVGAQFTQLN